MREKSARVATLAAIYIADKIGGDPALALRWRTQSL